MSFDRRTYAREYARKRRRARWTEIAMNSERCPAMLGNKKPCRAPLQNRGGTPFCPRCDLKARGLCIDCGTAPVDGEPRKALRCRTCKKLERAAAEDRWKKKHPGRVKAQWKRRKRRWQERPEEHAEALKRKRLWRQANPTRVRNSKGAWGRSAAARAYQKAYRARLSAERRERERERARLRKLGIIMTHPCTGCGAPLTGRSKKCDGCIRSAFTKARAILTGMAS